MDNPDSPVQLTREQLTQLVILAKDDPILRRKLTNDLGLKKGPYYTIQQAKRIKGVVDEMIEDKMDREFRIADFPQYTFSTLRQKIYGGLQYLTEQMDTNNKYSKWRSQVEVGLNTEKSAIVISYYRDDKEPPLIAHKIANTVSENIISDIDWKEWLEEALGRVGIGKSDKLVGLNLSTTDKQAIIEWFEPYEEWSINISTEKLILIHSVLPERIVVE